MASPEAPLVGSPPNHPMAARMPPTSNARSFIVRDADASSGERAFRAFWCTAARLRRLGEVRFATWGLSPAQWRVLRFLDEQARAGNRAVRATDLCDELLLNKATVSALMSRLLRMGLVSRSTLQVDQRARAVTLTPAGRRMVAGILEGHPAWMRQLMAGLSASERRVLARMLDKLGRWLDPLVEKTGSRRIGVDRAAPRRAASAARHTIARSTPA